MEGFDRIRSSGRREVGGVVVESVLGSSGVGCFGGDGGGATGLGIAHSGRSKLKMMLTKSRVGIFLGSAISSDQPRWCGNESVVWWEWKLPETMDTGIERRWR